MHAILSPHFSISFGLGYGKTSQNGPHTHNIGIFLTVWACWYVPTLCLDTKIDHNKDPGCVPSSREFCQILAPYLSSHLLGGGSVSLVPNCLFHNTVGRGQFNPIGLSDMWEPWMYGGLWVKSNLGCLGGGGRLGWAFAGCGWWRMIGLPVSLAVVVSEPLAWFDQGLFLPTPRCPCLCVRTCVSADISTLVCMWWACECNVNECVWEGVLVLSTLTLSKGRYGWHRMGPYPIAAGNVCKGFVLWMLCLCIWTEQHRFTREFGSFSSHILINLSPFLLKEPYHTIYFICHITKLRDLHYSPNHNQKKKILWTVI